MGLIIGETDQESRPGTHGRGAGGGNRTRTIFSDLGILRAERHAKTRTPLGQQVLGIAQAETEAMVEPGGVADDLGGKR